MPADESTRKRDLDRAVRRFQRILDPAPEEDGSIVLDKDFEGATLAFLEALGDATEEEVEEALRRIAPDVPTDT